MPHGPTRVMQDRATLWNAPYQGQVGVHRKILGRSSRQIERVRSLPASSEPDPDVARDSRSCASPASAVNQCRPRASARFWRGVRRMPRLVRRS